MSCLILEPWHKRSTLHFHSVHNLILCRCRVDVKGPALHQFVLGWKTVVSVFVMTSTKQTFVVLTSSRKERLFSIAKLPVSLCECQSTLWLCWWRYTCDWLINYLTCNKSYCHRRPTIAVCKTEPDATCNSFALCCFCHLLTILSCTTFQFVPENSLTV